MMGGGEGMGGGGHPPPIFKHSVLVVIIKSVPNQIQSSFMRGAKGARRKKNTCGSGSRPTLFFSADPIIF